MAKNGPMNDVSLILLVTLAAGLGSVVVRMPPLVGFLLAGFVLNALGVPQYDVIDVIAELGVALLLFTIGLTLDVRVLVRREIWLTTVVHMSVTTTLALAYLGVLTVIGIGILGDQDWRALLIVGFALSFSSTVLVLKVLDDKSSVQSRYGRTAVGVLIIQDLAAVVFLTIAGGEPPSPWAWLLLAVVPGGWVLRRLLRRIDHSELLPLFGVVLALVPGYALFDSLGLKGDLGALVLGLVLASEPRSEELSKALFSVKELLLVGFFLSIGFTGLPSGEDLLLAGLLLLLIPVKGVGFVALFWWQGMRRRTSVLAGTMLSNYSEFGLIVVALGATSDLVEEEWLVILATTVAASFVLSTIVSSGTERIVGFAEHRLPHQSEESLHPDDRPVDVGHADAVVLGMGRVGRAAYLHLEQEFGLRVVGIESQEDRAAALRRQGHEVLEGDATDPDFWQRLAQTGTVDIAVLAMPFHGANVAAMNRLHKTGFDGTVAVVARYDDEADELRERVHSVFGLYDGAGITVAEGAAEQAGLPRKERPE